MGNGLQNFLNLPRIIREKANKDQLLLETKEDILIEEFPDLEEEKAVLCVNDEISFKTDLDSKWYFITSDVIKNVKRWNSFKDDENPDDDEIYDNFNLILKEEPVANKIWAKKAILDKDCKHVITFGENNDKKIFMIFNNKEKGNFVFILFNREEDIAESLIIFDYDIYGILEDFKDRITIADDIFINIFKHYYLSDRLYVYDVDYWFLLEKMYKELGFNENMEL